MRSCPARQVALLPGAIILERGLSLLWLWLQYHGSHFVLAALVEVALCQRPKVASPLDCFLSGPVRLCGSVFNMYDVSDRAFLAFSVDYGYVSRCSEDKSLLRRALLQRRDDFVASGAALAAGSALTGSVTRLLLECPVDHIIAAYVPMRGEPDPIAGVAAAGRVLALPVVCGRDQPLVFRRWRPGDPLEEGLWGTRHPPASCPSVVPSMVLVPAVGFTGSGTRLGYGGGFYDRTLPGLSAPGSRVPAFAVAWECQRVDALPTEPHDIVLDGWVTEAGFCRLDLTGPSGLS